jgi:hypothetical protein
VAVVNEAAAELAERRRHAADVRRAIRDLQQLKVPRV